MGLDGLVRLGIIFGLFILLRFKKELILKYIHFFFAFSLILFMITGGLNPIWGLLKHYLFTESVEVMGNDLELHFFSVMQTVREASQIPFETFGQ